jgi:charged multivesicular body protein 4
LTVEKVEAAMDEIRDAMDNANDIGRSLAQSVGGGEMIDEDDLEAELAGLQDELDDEEVGDDDLLAELKSLEVSKTTIKTTTKTNGVKATNTKTAVAVTTKTKKKTEEELELEKMMAEMA